MRKLKSTLTILAVSASALIGTAGFGQATKGKDPIQIWHNDPATAKPAQNDHFTGAVTVQPILAPVAPGILGSALVTFAPGARTAWHTHPLGQLLIVTAGEGQVEAWGEPIHVIRTGDVVWIPPGEKHWHGAAPGTSMTHIAVVEQKDGSSVNWLEKVSDEQYSQPLPDTKPKASDSVRAHPSAKAIGDFDPKLAEITDNVLYGDVWERPELSKHDRSLVTIAALIAMNRPDQLRSHLIRGRENGVTQQEVVEMITQMAFYAGWPNAVSAIAVAKEVYAVK